MDFDLASKHKKEVEQRRKDAKRKLDQQRRDEEVRAALDVEAAAREAVRLKEAEEARLQAEEERRLNEGVQFVIRLQPVPSTRTDDKLVLPVSALEALESKGAIEQGSLLTFQVCLPSIRASGGRTTPGQTHAGVAEFTAEEGTVGVPPRVALCLTKGAGLHALSAVGLVEVRYVKLPRCAKSRVKFQPRGEGFHVGGLQTARLDLEHVLRESLRGHTALTEGDWLPIRHNNTTFELIVRELEPEPRLALLDTDLTVEVLPSEQTEAELRAEEERQAREEAAAREAEEQERLRLERAAARAMALHPEPDAGPESVQIRIRLPSGATLTRRFKRDTVFEQVSIWVESEPETHVRPEGFRLVQKWPGHARELGPAEAGETLGQLKFARQEALFLQLLGKDGATTGADAEEEFVEGGLEAQPQASTPAVAGDAAGSSEWAAAEERALKAMDRRLERADTPTAALREPELEEIRGTELVGVFERLVALGMPPPQAAAASKKYAAQLKELADMGFENWIAAVQLLEKYNGRLVRVTNLLSEGAGADADPATAFGGAVDASMPMEPQPAPEAASVPATVTQPAPAAAAVPLDKEVVAVKFRELVAAGVQPNEAATRAIQQVRQEMAVKAALAAAAVPEASSAASADAEDAEKLRELASMGFVDEDRNRALLRKYAGRLERAIEALISG